MARSTRESAQALMAVAYEQGGYDLEVDGGIYPGTTAVQSVRAGANVLVSGTAVFREQGAQGYGRAIAALRQNAS